MFDSNIHPNGILRLWRGAAPIGLVAVLVCGAATAQEPLVPRFLGGNQASFSDLEFPSNPEIPRGSGTVSDGMVLSGPQQHSMSSAAATLYDGPQEMFLHEFDELHPSHGGPGCLPGWSVTTDALFLRREVSTQQSFSTGLSLNDFGYDLGGRIALDRRFDRLVGWELAYLGPYAWNQGGQVTGTGLNVNLRAAGVNLSAFNNAVFQEQDHSSRLQSAEFSQKWWGWDVITTTAGLRYMHVDEDLLFRSVNAAAETGTMTVAANNNLVGGQVGMELHLPVGRLMSTVRLRGSIYSNFIDTRTSIVNAGVPQVTNAADEVTFSSVLEVGYYVSYQLTPAVTARAGYEAMWIYGLALAPDQVARPVIAATNVEADWNGDVFYQGGSFGVEVEW